MFMYILDSRAFQIKSSKVYVFTQYTLWLLLIHKNCEKGKFSSLKMRNWKLFHPLCPLTNDLAIRYENITGLLIILITIQRKMFRSWLQDEQVLQLTVFHEKKCAYFTMVKTRITLLLQQLSIFIFSVVFWNAIFWFHNLCKILDIDQLNHQH